MIRRMTPFHVRNHKMVVHGEKIEKNMQHKCGKTEAAGGLSSTSDLGESFAAERDLWPVQLSFQSVLQFGFERLKKSQLHTHTHLTFCRRLVYFSSEFIILHHKPHWSTSTIAFLDTQALRKGWLLLQSLVKVLYLFENRLSGKVMSSPKQVPLKMRSEKQLKELSFSAVLQR